MYRNTRRDFMKAIGLGAAAAALSGCTESSRLFPGQSSKGRPNIIFIFSDDHATQAISAYGSKINKTPNIDRIASEGAIFVNTFCGNSICAPSRATVLTGKHSNIHGKTDNLVKFDNTQPTFPKILKKAGYQTAIVGKWHMKTEPTGFDFWHILGNRAGYYNTEFQTARSSKKYIGYVTDIITDLTLNWLKNDRDKNKPFLLMCHYSAPHRPWLPGPMHLTMYDDVEIPEPPTLFDDYSGRSSVLKKNEMMIAKHMMYDYDLHVPGIGIPDELGRDFKNFGYEQMTPEQKRMWDTAYNPKNEKFKKSNLKGKDLVRWKYQRYVKDYLRCVASVDDNIGRLLDYLEKSGLSQNTIVVYSSDQGFYLGEHGWYDKRWMYEESLRMPFVMKWPGKIKPGTKIKHLAQNIDFAPTFLDAANVTIPDDMQGVSLLPLLKGRKPANWRDAIYYHYYEKGQHNVARHQGVRSDRYKLIHFYDTDEWELLDLKKDPHELKCVYNDPSYSNIVKKMKIKLKKLKAQYKVKF